MTAPGPHTSPGFWLHHAALTWRHACEARLGDITYPQFNMLSAVSLLTARGKPPTQQQAADFARHDRKMASKLIHTLMARGLLVREPDPDDARLRRIALTEEGRIAVRQCVAAARAADEEIFGGNPERERLTGDLRAIAERRADVR